MKLNNIKVLTMMPVNDEVKTENAFKHQTVNNTLGEVLSKEEHLILLCGHYEGIDQRVIDKIAPEEISIGDYVLSGGELAAAVIADSVVRLLPGVLNDETSALTDSFQQDLVSPPVYTRPANYKGWQVPEVLLSGHDKKIDEWRFQQSLERTRQRRPELLSDK